ncbi:polymorphic toxin type 44 domain-containing protein [Streptomyces sp. NPDC003077]|uniref:polymorphic toxin type 44 domain-containing protein n=1 Tax=Streptomyces sp. NPDC003077 TaxID=3154443 RepID=UPI0033B35497
MIKYEQLYHANLDALSKAAEAWETAVRKLTELGTTLSDTVDKPFRAAGWSSSDSSSETAGKLLADMSQEFRDAAAEARGIHSALSQAHDELKKCKDELLQLADSEAQSQGLLVTGTGEVKPRFDLSRDPGTLHDPDGPRAIQEQQRKCEDFAARLTKVLDRASQVDTQASWALKNNAGGNKSDFNPTVVTRIDEAEKYMKSEKRFTDAETYIFSEMKTNMKSDEVRAIQALLRPPKWYEIGRNPGSETTAALTMWFAKVAPHQDWDHKPKLTERYDLKKSDDFYFKQPNSQKEVFYDIYSNIHYGYVGRAAGFDQKTLIEGASVGESMFTGDDDEGDQITMRVGMELYDKYGENMTQEQLHQGIQDAMTRMEKAKAEGKDVPQIRDVK